MVLAASVALGTALSRPEAVAGMVAHLASSYERKGAAS